MLCWAVAAVAVAKWLVCFYYSDDPDDEDYKFSVKLWMKNANKQKKRQVLTHLIKFNYVCQDQ